MPMSEEHHSMPSPALPASLRRPGVGVPDHGPSAAGEELIVDDRSGLSPAQMVEDKLTRILQDSSLPVSQLQTRSLLRAR